MDSVHSSEWAKLELSAARVLLGDFGQVKVTLVTALSETQ